MALAGGQAPQAVTLLQLGLAVPGPLGVLPAGPPVWVSTQAPRTVWQTLQPCLTPPG